jgi:hypothetical protein
MINGLIKGNERREGEKDTKGIDEGNNGMKEWYKVKE